jgi:hypothetical protein
MTLQAQANSNPPDPVFGIGGLFFNLIDVAQGYVFDPAVVTAVSRKTHGSAGTFDVDLPLTGPIGIECRQGQGANFDAHEIVVTFPTSITLSSVSITSGIASLSGVSVSVNEVIVNLTGVANEQKIEITLAGVNNGLTISNVVVPMGVLLGDVNADTFVLSGDYTAVRQKSGLAADQDTFRYDVTADGFILSGDYTATRKQSGTHLP